MIDSVQPHRRQPTRLPRPWDSPGNPLQCSCLENPRLPRPWDSPGKITGVGCHFLLQYMKVKSETEVTQSCPTLRNCRLVYSPWLLCPWDFPGKSTGVSCHCLLRGGDGCALKESQAPRALDLHRARFSHMSALHTQDPSRTPLLTARGITEITLV